MAGEFRQGLLEISALLHRCSGKSESAAHAFLSVAWRDWARLFSSRCRRYAPALSTTGIACRLPVRTGPFAPRQEAVARPTLLYNLTISLNLGAFRFVAACAPRRAAFGGSGTRPQGRVAIAVWHTREVSGHEAMRAGGKRCMHADANFFSPCHYSARLGCVHEWSGGSTCWRKTRGAGDQNKAGSPAPPALTHTPSTCIPPLHCDQPRQRLP